MDAGGHDPQQSSGLRQDRRAELMLGALVCVVLTFVALLVVFVFAEAWPSFAHNGFGWFGAGGNPDKQIEGIFTSGNLLQEPEYTFNAWPIIDDTMPKNLTLLS
jgi:ABC-type phosphate transport system permease subunit